MAGNLIEIRLGLNKLKTVEYDQYNKSLRFSIKGAMLYYLKGIAGYPLLEVINADLCFQIQNKKPFERLDDTKEICIKIEDTEKCNIPKIKLWWIRY